MRYNIYSIRDQVGGIYTAPWLQTNNGTAIRDLQDKLERESDSRIAKHKKDFTLCQIGEYDDETAEITPCQPNIVVHLTDLDTQS